MLYLSFKEAILLAYGKDSGSPKMCEYFFLLDFWKKREVYCTSPGVGFAVILCLNFYMQIVISLFSVIIHHDGHRTFNSELPFFREMLILFLSHGE
jgi:hypothetical protein